MTSSHPPQEPASLTVAQPVLSQQILRQHPWLSYVLPFAVFMLAGLLEPAMPPARQEGHPFATTQAAERASNGPVARASDRSENAKDVPAGQPAATSSSPDPARPQAWLSYPTAYTARIALTLAAIVLVWPSWRVTPGGVHGLSVWVGILGGVLWVGICRGRFEDRLLTLIGLEQWASWGDRQAFDPYTHFAGGVTWLVAFLALRFVALTLIVPLFEEFFLRGFLMRFPLQADWWNLPLGSVTWASGAIVVAYAVLSHPAEPIAAALWFTLITLLYARTRSLWDCVIAHGVTNGIMGVYILVWRDWTLW